MKKVIVSFSIVLGIFFGSIYAFPNIPSPLFQCQDVINIIRFQTLKEAQKWIKENRKTIRAPQIRVLKDYVEVSYRERICR